MAEDLAAVGPADGRAGGNPFVGRAGELAQLREALDEAALGHGSVMLLAGEPGIGKTSLARALTDDAERRGARTVWGVGWSGGGAPAYWPWIQVARALLRSADGAERDAGIPAAASLAAILPELRGAAGDGSDAPPPATDEGRFRIYDALSELLRSAAEAAPLVVVLDDLQWADDASLITLAFVARTLADARVLLLGTYRATELPHDDAGASPLTELVGWSRRIDLSGLDPADVRLVVDRAGGGGTPDALVERIHDVTMGNPLFVSELVTLLDAEGRLDDLPGASGLRLPAGVGEVIAHRLAPLPSGALEALRVGSVIGPEFQLATLAHASGVADDVLRSQLDAGVRHGVLVPVADAADRYAFSHELVQATLYDGMPEPRRRALHGAVGEALEALQGDGDAPLTELAHHFLAAAVGRDERAIAYARRAGDRAMEQFAYDQAAGLFARGLAASGPARSPERIELLQSLGEAQTRSGDTGAARRTLLEAAAAARLAGDPDAFTRAVLACGIWGLTFGVDEDLVRLADEGILLLEPGRHDGQLARLKGLLATALYWSGETERRLRLCEEALALARAEEQRDPGRAGAETMAYVLGRALLALWGPESATKHVALADELIERARKLSDVELELLARNWRISVLIETGDVAAADQEIARVEHMAAKLRQPRARAFLPLHHGMRAIASGRFDEAEHLIAESEEIGRQVHGSVSELAATVQRLAIRLLQGRLPEVEAPLRALSDAHPGMVALRCALIVLLVQADRPDEARGELARLMASGPEGIPPDNTRIVSLALLGEAAVDLGEGAYVADLRAGLEPYAGRWVTSPGAATLWPVDRSLGRLSGAIGETDAALRHLTAARRQAERLGGRPALALIALDEAAALAARSAPADAEQVAALLGEAGGLADELGMATVQRAVAALGGAAPAPVDPAGAAHDMSAGTLRREGDVWTLALGDRLVRMRDAKGLRHLALLLSHPGVAFHAADVVAAGEGRGAGPDRVGRPGADDALSIRAAGAGDAGPVLDPQAKEAYRRRLEDLREELEEAEEFNDPERVARARTEYEFVAAELAGAVGLGGRDRRMGSDAERARVNATRAIRGTVQRVSRHDARLGRLLDRTIRTGTFCAYEPDPDQPIVWTIET